MKIYLVALGVGILVGIIYGLLNVRSPAPPVVALVGLLGMLVGEQVVPMATRPASRRSSTRPARYEPCSLGGDDLETETERETMLVLPS